MLILKKYILPCVKGKIGPLKQNQQRKIIEQVIHDVRSPVAAMNMLIDYDLENVSHEVRTLLKSQIERIQSITNDLSRTNKEQGSICLKTQFLPSLIEEIVGEKKVLLKSRPDICLECSYNAECFFHDCYAKVDATEFKRILSNLINNAIEAWNKGHLKICVKLEKEERWFKDYIKVIIQDNGRGIPQAIVSKIFQEHYSYGKEGMENAGSGLGLYHAKMSIESWSGQIRVSSQERKGTHFSLVLPKA